MKNLLSHSNLPFYMFVLKNDLFVTVISEPTSSKDSKSKYLAIYFGVPIAVVFLIVIFVCLRKKLRPR